MKIISFNIGTTHLMHFNKRTNYPLGEEEEDKRERVSHIKMIITDNISKEKADFLCIQEGFADALPARYANLNMVSFYQVKHGPIGGGESSFLATYVNLEKYTVEENNDFNTDYQRIYHRRGVGFPCRTQIFKLTDIKTGKKTILVNLHGVGAPNPDIRRIILEFLSAFLSETYPSDDVIIVGDINTNLQRRTGEAGEIAFASYVRDTIFNQFDVFPRDDRKKSSYHRFIKQDDGTFTDKLKKDRYDCLDYCLVKKHMGKEVSVKRLPSRFVGKEVPYKLNETTNIVEPNFFKFPSDHTLNVYTIKHRPGFLGLGPGPFNRIPRIQSKKGRSTNNKRKVSTSNKKKTVKRKVKSA